MNEIIQMFSKIENEPDMFLADKRLDYLFNYWMGVNVGEPALRSYLFYSTLPEWIEKCLLANGYKVNFSLVWYKMLYSAFENEEDRWDFFFSHIYIHIRKCGKKQTEQEYWSKNSQIKNINEWIHLIYGRPGIAIGSSQKRIDYITHHFAGIYSKEDENFNSKEFEQITQYIYTYLVSKGYSIEKSKWWHKMINQITTDEDEAWELLFEGLTKCFEQK